MPLLCFVYSSLIFHMFIKLIFCLLSVYLKVFLIYCTSVNFISTYTKHTYIHKHICTYIYTMRSFDRFFFLSSAAEIVVYSTMSHLFTLCTFLLFSFSHVYCIFYEIDDFDDCIFLMCSYQY